MHISVPNSHRGTARSRICRARGFGVIVAADERGPRASHVPFVVDQRDGRVVVQLHLTARNPLVELATAPGVFS